MRAYAQLLRRPHVAILLGATTLTRLPFAINGLAVLLFVREVTGSFATAGLVTGALGLGTAVGAPAGGPARRPARCGDAAAAGAHARPGPARDLAARRGRRPGRPSLAVAALCAGTAFPPSGSVLRSRWGELAGDPDLVRTAYALDSVMIEVSFVTRAR